jgi:predicted HicB family RNase H-like nuclease
MKDEYDFSKGERGKFYKPDARLNLPVYLDDDVRRILQRQAKEKGIEVNELVNDLLKHEIAQARRFSR